jgi:acid phosphatase type 7
MRLRQCTVTASVTALLVVTFVNACQSRTPALPPCEKTAEFPALVGKRDVTIIAAGDVVDCKADNDEKTAALIEKKNPDAVLALGDLTYPNGTLEEFASCYGPSWGRFRSKTRPSVGNHEYHTANAGPYYAYFCGTTGEAFRGYYSYDIGPWHMISLNTNCDLDLDLAPGAAAEAGGCGPNSPQAEWLRRDLAANSKPCTLAAWHHPRFTTGGRGHRSEPKLADLWRILDDAKVDVVLNAHVHSYERFAPQDADGNARVGLGLREFVVGTGGRTLSAFAKTAAPNSEFRNDQVFGVLEMKLAETGYSWQFVDVDGVVRDSGSDQCRE